VVSGGLDIQYGNPNPTWNPAARRSNAPLHVALHSVDMLSTAHRSHYEGTSFDMTVGIAAGAHGSPDRYAVPGSPVPTIDIATGFPLKSDPIRFMGAWERSVVRPLPPPRLLRRPVTPSLARPGSSSPPCRNLLLVRCRLAVGDLPRGLHVDHSGGRRL